MERALENYTRHTNKLERTIHGGNVHQDDHDDVAVIVANATSKHTDVLNGLLGTAPEAAIVGITKARDASIKGHDTAPSRTYVKSDKRSWHRDMSSVVPALGHLRPGPMIPSADLVPVQVQEQ